MSTAAPVQISVFLSSPGDVADERGLARKVLARLNKDPSFRGRVRLDEVSWDDPDAAVPLAAHLTPQEAINRVLPKPSECDFVVVILWSRMGTPLPSDHRKPDGTPYVSGTEWEYLDAVAAAQRNNGRPVMLVYRRMEDPKVELRDPARDDKIRQFESVEAFFAGFGDAVGASRRSYKQYERPSQLADLLEGNLREELESRLQKEPHAAAGVGPEAEPLSDQVSEVSWHGNPYRGLSAFRPDDFPIFFGRGAETDDLVARLRSPEVRVLAVIGPSGSGKSSLVAAGLLPRLAAGALPNSADWEVVRITPAEAGDDPFRALALRLAPRMGVKADALADRLRRRPDEIDPVAGEALAQRPPTAELLLFVDQFEELFSPRVAEEHRGPFVALINAVATSTRARLVLTLRADYFEHCTRFETLAGRLNSGGYTLAAPGSHALGQMVERPARAAGLRIDTALVDRVLKDTGSELGALALMEFTLERLYDARSDHTLTADAYDALGGVPGAVEIQGEQSVRDERGRLDAQALERVFRALADVDEQGGAVRRRAPLDGFAEAERVLVDRLIAARLLTAGRDSDGTAVVEVAHEAVLRHWDRFRRWLAENRDLLLWRRRLELLREGGGYLTGAYLAEAKGWLERSPQGLEEGEAEYIRQSIGAARRRSLSIRGTVLALLLLSAAGFGWRFYEVRAELAAERERMRPIYREEDWVEIPAGEFWMGSGEEDKEAFDSEKPRRPVKITKPFKISRYEVTVEEYNRFALATDREPAFSAGFGEDLSPELRKRLPAIYVSWDDAVKYAQWLSKRIGKRFRLPTEAEWEYAARAQTQIQTQTRRYWGDDPDHREACTYANVYDEKSEPTLKARYGAAMSWDSFRCPDPYPYTAPVGQLKPNALGLYDMLGNVYEWVQDCWHGSYEGAPKDGSRPWLKENDGNCSYRVVRGGSWFDPPAYVRSASRFWYASVTRNGNVGFRLAQDL